MSDFISDFWSHYVTVITVVSILACLLLLWRTARRGAPMSDDNTTGHVWDEDLREMNNPMPRWWMGLFLITIVFGFVYLALYPGLGKSVGQWGWSSRGAYDTEVAKANEELAPIYSGFAAMPIPELSRSPQAMAIGERLFMNNCAQCHGSDAHGSKGFPNLTDNEWLWGGSPEQIEQTITHGRTGVMTPMAEQLGSAEDVQNVANYVLSLAGEPHDSVRAKLGEAKFTVCAACHGPGGEGNELIGAPRFIGRKSWLHGYGLDAVISQINTGKTNEMPAQEGKLSPQQIHVLAAYVWGLSNNKPGVGAAGTP